MPVVDIPLGDWLPDAPSFKNPGCEVADNVIPVTGGYGPFPAILGQGQSVTGAVQGAQQFFDNAGNSLIVGGTSTRLFIRRAAITQTTGLSAIGAGEAWDFCQFNDFVIATANANPPQYLVDIDVTTAWTALPGTPPLAKRCAKVGDFLMLGNISGVPNRIQWSGFNQPASWTISRLTQSGFLDLPMEYGDVQRIVGGRYATVFQERGITRLSYVGPPLVWRADIISQDRGAIAPFSVITVGYFTFFLAQDGFKVTNGASVQDIGSRRVNKWFFENVNQARIKEVHAAIDWQNECVMWAFHGVGSETYNRVLVYSWAQERFSTATVDFEWLVGSALDGVTLDALDAIYGNLDAIPLSLDSAEFAPKDRRLAAFVSGQYSTFTGDPLEATWDTGEFQPSPGQRVHVTEVTPVMQADNWDMMVTLLGRDNRGQFNTSATKECGWGGFAPVRLEAQKMALRIMKPATGPWSEAQAAQVRFRAAGFR